MFIGHYSNMTLFYHTHIIDNVRYCHSHFYRISKSTNSVQLPVHSKEQLKLIKEFNQFTWNSVCQIPVVEKPVYQLTEVFLCPNLVPDSLAKLLFSPLRAPPSFII